jgi:hypothetical protein
MSWRSVWHWLRPSRVPSVLGEYENVVRWADRRGFYTATRRFPAESSPSSFLLRVESNRDAEASMRLTLQARRHAQLESPYIPRLCDLGLADEWWYVAMHIDPPIQPLSRAQVDGLTLVRQLAECLSYLHEQGFAHRAVCPDSIAVDRAGTPLLFDLRWMASFQADRTVRSVLARRPRSKYDPPEAGEEFDGVRGDVYSLGVLAAEIGVSDKYVPVVHRMKQLSVVERPCSMAAVLQELTS